MTLSFIYTVSLKVWWHDVTLYLFFFITRYIHAYTVYYTCPLTALLLGQSTAEEDWIQCRPLASSLHPGIVVDGRQGKVARQTHCAFGIVWRKCRNKIPRPHATAPYHACQIATFWGTNNLRRRKYQSLFLWEANVDSLLFRSRLKQVRLICPGCLVSFKKSASFPWPSSLFLGFRSPFSILTFTKQSPTYWVSCQNISHLPLSLQSFHSLPPPSSILTSTEPSPTYWVSCQNISHLHLSLQSFHSFTSPSFQYYHLLRAISNLLGELSKHQSPSHVSTILP